MYLIELIVETKILFMKRLRLVNPSLEFTTRNIPTFLRKSAKKRAISKKIQKSNKKT